MYTTAWINKILKSKKAKSIVEENLPPRYGQAYTILWLFQVIGAQLDEMDQWVTDFRDQILPQTTTWGIDFWEHTYGIQSNTSWPIERRRQNLLNRIQQHYAMNPKRVENILSSVSGAPVRIEENTGKNHFTVWISAISGYVDEESIRAELDRIKPAHLIYDIQYEQSTTGLAYIGGTILKKPNIVIGR